MPDIYLASQSPRRRELLLQIGVSFEVVGIDVPEQRVSNESPLDYVKRLAQTKAMAGLNVADDKPVLGADTIVVLGQDDESLILEKPRNKSHGMDMLMSLSGKQHRVITAVAMCDKGRLEVRVNQTLVEFRKISEQEASTYWHTGEPADKAGAYGIQGLGGVFVRKLEGSYSSVVGLPLFETTELLAMFNIAYWQ